MSNNDELARPPLFMKTLNINVTKIDKSAIYEGKNGKYVSLVLFENKEGRDQYGNDGFVTQDIGKDRRLAGERGPIIGNWKEMGDAKPAQTTQTPPITDADDDDIPF
jgi:hypothetical protein